MSNTYDITQKLQAIADAITQGGGGGGTTVIANPSGTPTDTLNTIQIGSTIYDIAGSGGGGGGVTSNILYSGNAYASIINLNYDLFNYDLINVLVSDSNGYIRGFAFSPSELLNGQTIGFDNNYGYIWYVITSGTVLTASAQSNFFIKDIIGFRSSSGALPELISDDFDPTLAYTIGDYCIYDNTLYKFTSAKSAGAWDNTKVSDTTVGEELTDLNSNITGVSSSITGYNTSYIDGVSITCIEICNNLVILSGAFKPKATNIPNGTQIITGIPKVGVAVFGSAVNANGNAYKIVANAGNTYIQKDEAQTPTNAWYNFMLIYIKADS